MFQRFLPGICESKMALNLVDRVVLPGDILGNEADLEASVEGKSKVKLGPGLRQEKGSILAYKAGVLRHRKPGTYWVDCNQRRVGADLNPDPVALVRHTFVSV